MKHILPIVWHATQAPLWSLGASADDIIRGAGKQPVSRAMMVVYLVEERYN